MEKFKIASEFIEQFCLDESKYTEAKQQKPEWIRIANGGENKVYVNSRRADAQVNLMFKRGCSNSRVFLGDKIAGIASITVEGSNSLIFLGSRCNLRKLKIRSVQDNDFIALGNNTTITLNAAIISGNGAGNANPYIVVGDDCMFSIDITVRNADGHPIFDATNMHQLNTPSAGVLIEPHVWLGQGTQVLKDVTIGACSVVAAGSIVSTDLPRFSVACGVPAKILRQDIKNIWSRGYSKMHVDQAIFYRNKFLPDK